MIFTDRSMSSIRSRLFLVTVVLAFPLAAFAMQLPDHADTSVRQLPVSITHVDTRELFLEQHVVEALASGRLTVADAEKFKNELDGIIDREARYRQVDGTMSAWENMELNLDLDRLGKSIEMAQRERQTATSDLRARLEQLDRLLTDAVGSGRLTAGEATGFRSELSRIWGEQMDAPATQGGDESEPMALSKQLDSVCRELETKMRPRPIAMPDLDAFQAQLNRRVKDGLATGQLTAEEVTDLSDELDRLSKLENQLRAAAGGIKAEDALQLAVDFQQLDRRITGYMCNEKMSSPSIADRQGVINDHIAEALSSGRLAGNECDELREELRRIVKIETTLDSEGDIKPEERLTLAMDLDRLNRAVDKPLTDRLVAWSGIEERKADLNRRIARGLVCGRITPAEARDYWNRYHRLVDADKESKGNDGGLTFSEGVALALELDRLRALVEAKFAGGNQVWPGLDGQRRETSKQVGQALSDGKVNLKQSRKLSADLQRTAHTKATLRTAHGSLSADEAISLASDLERINTQLDRLVTTRSSTWSGIEQKRVQLEGRVAAAMRSGKLSTTASEGLKSSLIRISNLEACIKSPSGGLGLPGAITAASELDRVDRQLGGPTR